MTAATGNGPHMTRALTHSGGLPALRRSGLPAAIGRRMLPVAGSTIAAAAVSLAAEYALRSTVNSVVARALAPIRRVPPSITRGMTRTIVTEWTVVERVRRR